MKNEDIKHLEWLYERMSQVHNENKNYDYMVRFRGIIDNLKGSIQQELKEFADAMDSKSYKDYEKSKQKDFEEIKEMMMDASRKDDLDRILKPKKFEPFACSGNNPKRPAEQPLSEYIKYMQEEMLEQWKKGMASGFMAGNPTPPIKI
jgi:hypothetical protein